MDWRMEAMATPWMDSDVTSGFATFILIDVEGSMTSWSSWKTPPGWLAEVLYVSEKKRDDFEGGGTNLTHDFGCILVVDAEI
jgi:hypothetical protein